jgi:hypothetical protein
VTSFPVNTYNPLDLPISVSKIEDACGKEGNEGCNRRWWFHSVQKLPQPQSAPTIFGDVHHAVLARYYMADDRGMDATGHPVDLYPPGWQTMVSRFDRDKDTAPKYTIDVMEEAIIKGLIATALKDGILLRQPGRRVEVPIERVLYTEPGLAGAKINLKGFIDLETNQSVEDHKTHKNTDWVVPAKRLSKQIQLITYAYDRFERNLYEEELLLAHNNYIKNFDEPQVIRRTAKVSREYVYGFYKDVVWPCIERMYRLYKQFPKGTVDQWRKIPGPYNQKKECNKHFGKECPYIRICNEVHSVSHYLAVFAEKEAMKNNPIPPITKGNSIMASLLDTAKKEQQNLAASIGQPPAPAVAPSGVPMATPQQAGQTATPPQASKILANLSLAMAAAKAKQGGAVPPAASTPAVVTQAPAPIPTPAVVAPVVQATPTPAPAKAPQQRTPWHIPGCAACSSSTVMGYIFANGGKSVHPCQTCEAMAISAGLPTAKDYKVWVGPKGAPNEGVVCFQLLSTPNGDVFRGDTPIVEPEPEPVQEEPQPDPMGLAGVLGGLAQMAPAPVVAPTETVTPGKRKRRTQAQMAEDAAKTATPLSPPTPAYTPANPFTGTPQTIPFAEDPSNGENSAVPVSLPGNAQNDLPGGTPEESLEESRCTCNGEPGFNLLRGCVIFIDGKDTVISADEVLAMALGQIESKLGKQIAAIPYFDLLSAVDAHCATIAKALNGLSSNTWIVSTPITKGTPMSHLIDGLQQYAKRVIVGLAG